MKLKYLALPLFLALENSAMAQEILGTSVLAGKKVHLYADGTWKYADIAQNGKCIPVHQNVDFCGNILNWKPQKGTRDFDRIFTHSDRIHAGLIVEEIGANDGNSMEHMRNIALEGAAEASGVETKDIPVFTLSEAQVDGMNAETMIYGAKIDGMKFVYANTIIVESDLTIQAMVWAFASEFTDEHKKWHADFIDNIRVNIQEKTQ